MHSSTLDEFWCETMTQVGMQTIDLPVNGPTGVPRIVVALGEEPVLVLFQRVAAAGGYANVFIRDEDRIFLLAVMPESDALFSAKAEDMTTEPPSLFASVSMFLAYLRRCPNGILVPALRPATADEGVARVSHEVQELQYA